MGLEFGQGLKETLVIPGTGPERIRTIIYPEFQSAAEELARIIARKIRQREAEGRRLVLGLPTGTTPIPVFRELVGIHRKENLSFKNLVVFVLDEYYPLSPESPSSYNHLLHKELFSQVDIPADNIHTLRGDVPEEELYDYCAAYEKAITEAGGMDIQLLGVGRTGHLGFNEPGSPTTTATRVVSLDKLTRIDASEVFLGLENVPPKALTLGIETIMSARQVYLMASGSVKATIIREVLEGEVSTRIPPTVLQHHTNAVVFLDQAAASGLTRFINPWLVGACDWTDRLIRKAVVWLCLRVEKPVLKLTDRHYSDNGLGELITKHGPAGKINIKVFNDLQHTISGWPGGKPEVDDQYRPERNTPYPKRCVVFSPHPDDDVISMGGTLSRLVEQKHQVHVAYQTSGNMAVADEYIVKHLHFIENYQRFFSLSSEASIQTGRKIRENLANRTFQDADSGEIRRLKGLIRRGEAVTACGSFGIPEEQLHFLDLPFYEASQTEKQPFGREDVAMVVDLLETIKPHQIFAAGDLADPHGTHKICIEIVMEALAVLKGRNTAWLKDCWLWLYRGAWQDWDLEAVDMAVPISPDELAAKTRAILKHTSQKDGALFMGEDSREFWQRAEDRNRATARLYDRLGMAEYEAMELFVRHRF